MLPVYQRLFAEENLRILVYSGEGDATVTHVGEVYVHYIFQFSFIASYKNSQKPRLLSVRHLHKITSCYKVKNDIAINFHFRNSAMDQISEPHCGETL